jgi:hypothetical protein
MKNDAPTAGRRTPITSSPAVPFMNLHILLAIHAAVTFAAGVVLIAAPDLIPSAVGIRIDPGSYLMCYLLAASELSLAALSWGGRTLTDMKSLRVIVWACLVLHASSGILEIYVFAQGLSAAIWSNVALRAVVIFLFAYYGLYKLSKDTAEARSPVFYER